MNTGTTNLENNPVVTTVTREEKNKNMYGSIIKISLIQLTYFLIGIVASRGAVFGVLSPFGVALIATAPFNNLAAVTSGTVLGCLFPYAINDSIRYIASLLAVGAIRWTLNDLSIVSKNRLFAPIITVLPLVATGLTLNFLKTDFDTYFLLMCLIEALIAATGAYFFQSSLKILDAKRGITTLNQEELVCTVLTVCILLLTFSNINVGYISLGRTLAIMAILLCAHYGSVAGGSIAGISAGIIFSVSSTELSYITGAYAFGGLMAGLFSSLGKFGTIVAFILASTIITLQAVKSEIIITSMYEMIIASILFMIIPKKYCSKLRQVFKTNLGLNSADELKKSLIMKIGFVSKALTGVSDCVEQVSTKLKQLDHHDIDFMLRKACDKFCNRCGIKRLCWEEDYYYTSEVFESVIKELKNNKKLYLDDFPDILINRCNKISEICKTMNNCYDNYLKNTSVKRRINEVRAVVYDQFYGMSEILEDIAQELQEYEEFDNDTSGNLYELLRELRIPVVDISCRIDNLNRMSVEMILGKTDDILIINNEVLRKISKVCDRSMDTPLIVQNGDFSRVQISQKANLSIKLGVMQHICNNGGLCGDNYHYFNDGMGRMVIIISDGMGTGGRAAVDGAMASSIMMTLLKSGITMNCALRIVNSALLVKSDEESLATLDIARIDLFNGKTEFFKAGAPVTIIKKADKVIRIDNPSLPLGILTDIEFAKNVSQLNKNDKLLMISDGVNACGDSWLEREMQKWNQETEQDFAEKIVRKSQSLRTDGRDDDITAIAVTLGENIS